jgi:hypothetical protein
MPVDDPGKEFSLVESEEELITYVESFLRNPENRSMEAGMRFTTEIKDISLRASFIHKWKEALKEAYGIE